MTPLTITEAAAFTGYTVGTLYQKVHTNQIPFYKPSPKKLVFSKEELEAFIFSGRVKTEVEIDKEASRILRNMQRKRA